jgi:hypothetical protein
MAGGKGAYIPRVKLHRGNLNRFLQIDRPARDPVRGTSYRMRRMCIINSLSGLCAASILRKYLRQFGNQAANGLAFRCEAVFRWGISPIPSPMLREGGAVTHDCHASTLRGTCWRWTTETPQAWPPARRSPGYFQCTSQYDETPLGCGPSGRNTPIAKTAAR